MCHMNESETLTKKRKNVTFEKWFGLELHGSIQAMVHFVAANQLIPLFSFSLHWSAHRFSINAIFRENVHKWFIGSCQKYIFCCIYRDLKYTNQIKVVEQRKGELWRMGCKNMLCTIKYCISNIKLELYKWYTYILRVWVIIICPKEQYLLKASCKFNYKDS